MSILTELERGLTVAKEQRVARGHVELRDIIGLLRPDKFDLFDAFFHQMREKYVCPYTVRDYEDFKAQLFDFWAYYLESRGFKLQNTPLIQFHKNEAFAFVQSTVGGDQSLQVAARNSIAGRDGAFIAFAILRAPRWRPLRSVSRRRSGWQDRHAHRWTAHLRYWWNREALDNLQKADLQRRAAARAARWIACVQLPRFFPEFSDESPDAKDGPGCSAAEELERQEPFVNPTLADHALALLTRLFRYGRMSTMPD